MATRYCFNSVTHIYPGSIHRTILGKNNESQTNISQYQGGHSVYYTENHKKFRAVVRKFVEEELKPNVDKWIGKGYPRELHERAYQLGINGLIYPREHGGTKPDDFDAFYELILIDEISRVTGFVMYQMQINSMGLPPILYYGSDELKQKVCRDVISGKKVIYFHSINQIEHLFGYYRTICRK